MPPRITSKNMSKETSFVMVNGMKRTILSSSVLDELEKSSTAKHFQNVVDELNEDPENFNEIMEIKKAEIYAFSLAAEYSAKFQNKLVSNKELNILANMFVKHNSFQGTIKKYVKDLEMLLMPEMVVPLIKVAKKCVDAAHQFEKYRYHSRQDSNFEILISNSTRNDQRGERNEKRFVGMEQQIFEIKNILLANQIQAPLAAIHHPQQLGQQLPILPQRNANDPSWIVSREKCGEFFDQDNVKDYAEALFATCESLLSHSKLTEFRSKKEFRNYFLKKKEFNLIYNHFKPEANDWEEKFYDNMDKLTSNKRQIVFKLLKKHMDMGISGYGISDSGKEFFYKRSASNRYQCFSKVKCNVGPQLETKKVGKRHIPEKCSNFNYILFIEKNKRQAEIQIMLSDGTIHTLQG